MGFCVCDCWWCWSIWLSASITRLLHIVVECSVVIVCLRTVVDAFDCTDATQTVADCVDGSAGGVVWLRRPRGTYTARSGRLWRGLYKLDKNYKYAIFWLICCDYLWLFNGSSHWWIASGRFWWLLVGDLGGLLGFVLRTAGGWYIPIEWAAKIEFDVKLDEKSHIVFFFLALTQISAKNVGELQTILCNIQSVIMKCVYFIGTNSTQRPIGMLARLEIEKNKCIHIDNINICYINIAEPHTSKEFRAQHKNYKFVYFV